MRQSTAEHLTGLLADHAPPCISLYQSTHRNHPENQQDPIRYRNLLTEMENSLRQKYPTREVRTLLEKFQSLARDANFWKHRTDGLAILGSAETFQLFELQRPVKTLLVIADSFHTKPLLRALQAADRYQILGLNRHEAKLYEGNRDKLDEVELADAVPATIEEALGAELTEPHTTVASYGMGAGGGGLAMHHGHGQKKDEVETDNDRFFRAIDRAILAHHSRPTGLPLMLAALPEHHDLFHKVSHNPFLMSDGIMMNPDALDLDQLRAEAWRIVEPAYLHRLAKMSDDFQLARSRDLGSDNLAQIAEAATAGRVATLLIEDDRQIPGRIDRATGQVQPADLSDLEVDDMLDDLAEIALRMKGEVVVVPAERMPSKSGVAAIYRFRVTEIGSKIEIMQRMIAEEPNAS
jgi:hypothetical protein